MAFLGQILWDGSEREKQIAAKQAKRRVVKKLIWAGMRENDAGD